MTPELANVALQFLARAEMKGAEVPAFNAVVAALAAIAQPPAPPAPAEAA